VNVSIRTDVTDNFLPSAGALLRAERVTLRRTVLSNAVNGPPKINEDKSSQRARARALDGVADGRAGVRRGPKGVAVEDGPTARLPREGAGEVGGGGGGGASERARLRYLLRRVT